MKKRRSDTEKPHLFLYDILFRAVGMLFLLVMLSLWLICGMFAKYVVTDENSDQARAAAFASVEVLEHEAILENGLYQLTENEVTKNTYSKVIPGVDIPKDPFVRLSGTPEVTCVIYLKVTASENFLETVTYVIDDTYWSEVSNMDNVYKYTETLPPGTTLRDIPILRQIGDTNDGHVCELKVSENYDGFDKDGEPIEFNLTFSAWLVQID